MTNLVTRQFDSASSSAVYTAQLDPATSATSCSCPAWRFKKLNADRTCKHVKELAAGALVTHASGKVSIAPRQAMTSGLGRGVAGRQLPARVLAHESPSPDAIVKPMLASAMTRMTFKDHANDAWRLEIKWDGQRVTVRKAGAVIAAFSRPRAGKDALPRELPAGITTALRQLPDGLYDGELVSPGGRSWQVARLDTRATQILVLFDVIELLGQNITAKSYAERREMLLLTVAHHTNRTDAPRLMVPDSVPVTWEAVEAIWANGGEGAILKRVASTYQPGKRSPSWVKVKRVASATLTITGYEPGKTGPYATVQLRGDAGQTTTVKTKDNATMAAMAKDPASFIGRRLVIAYCELTDDGHYRHGVWDHLAGPGE